jgi:hypothetical protein
MGFYQGYNRFKGADGKLRITYITLDGMINIEEFGQPIITIKSTLSLEEKVKTFIHEILHMTDEYWQYLGQNLDLDHPAEKKVESEVQVIYDSQPHLVEYLKKIIQENQGKKS